MRRVADMNLTPPTTPKPLFPWVAFGAFTILVMLLLGVSSRYLVRFQKPYSFEAVSQHTIEIVDAPVIRNVDAKPSLRNQIGQTASEDKKGNAGPQISQKVSTSDTEGDSSDRNKTIQVEAYWASIADAALDLPNRSPKHTALFTNLAPIHPQSRVRDGRFQRLFPEGKFYRRKSMET